MNKALMKTAFTVGLLAMLLVVPVYGASVNKSIRIDAGSEADGAMTVNGSVSVGEGAVVTGELETVNGRIRVDDNSTIEDAATVNGSVSIGDGVSAEDISTVNGAINIGEDSTVAGDVDAVNGSIALAKGGNVAKNVSNVNGSIELEGSEVGGNVSTVSGDVDLSDAAVIQGDLIIEKPNSWGWGKKNSRVPKIIIGPGSEVRGTIKLEREVELYISDSAKVAAVEGVMAMSDAVRFSGKRP